MKTSFILVALLIISAMLVGCHSNNSGNKIDFTYPDDISGMCHAERNEAKSCIESKIGIVKYKKDLVLEKRPGTKKISGEWVWSEPVWQNKLVSGLTWDKGDYYLIQVACNPKTMQEISSGVVRHEHGHYFLMSNFGEHGHNSLYSSCFLRWYDLRGKGTMKTMETEINGEKVIIDYYDEQDFVLEKVE